MKGWKNPKNANTYMMWLYTHSYDTVNFRKKNPTGNKVRHSKVLKGKFINKI